MSKRVITFGQWDGKPIKWLVLKEDEFKTFVVSKYPLFSCRFNKNRNDGNRWKTSLLRNYLNSTFWETAFSAEEKKKVVNCMLEHPDHTKDNVFVLSKEEAENLLTQKERTSNFDCFLRSPYGDNNNQVHCVYANGIINWFYITDNFYICPALYLKNIII